MRKRKIYDLEYKKKCPRCKVFSHYFGDHCGACTSELADELYLDEGGTHHVHEDIDRKVTGEYAETNEGDDKGDDDEG
jgi:hypothetical protein